MEDIFHALYHYIIQEKKNDKRFQYQKLRIES